MIHQTESRGSMWYVIGISMIAALGGFLFGFDMTVVSGTLPLLRFGRTSRFTFASDKLRGRL